MKLSWQQAIGIDQSHLISLNKKNQQVNFDPFSIEPLIHPSIENDLNRLMAAARNDGLEIAIVSSFRSFNRQLDIWNNKWQGHRPVYCQNGKALEIDSLSATEKFHAISLWSALPGLSRHHWGSDLDIFLLKPIQSGYQVELITKEFSQSGVCHQLEYWMDENLNSFGFFRPYRYYQQGISSEPWHISHRNTSQNILSTFPFGSCIQQLRESNIEEKELVVNLFEDYKEGYFLNLCDV